LQFVGNTAASVATVMKPAGLEKSVGIISGAYLKDPTDSHWQNDPGLKQWLDFMDRYFPEGDKNNGLSVYGYSVAQTLVQVLTQCGNQLTRENVMRQAANLKGLRLGMLLPGIVINTSASTNPTPRIRRPSQLSIVVKITVHTYSVSASGTTTTRPRRK